MSDQILPFLRSLFGAKPEETRILIWTLHNKLSRWASTVEEAVAFVEETASLDTYVGVALSPKSYGSDHRCPANEVAGIAGLYADVDIKGDAHAVKALPATVGEALKIVPPGFAPSFVIWSGHGVHYWWLFKEPWVFDTPEEREAGALLVQRWQALLRLRASSHGWMLDHTHDLARVLRVPGSMNLKSPTSPKPVSILDYGDARYTIGAFEEALEDAGIPESFGAPDVKRTGDDSITVDLTVKIDQEWLDSLFEVDKRFKATWLKQRYDITGQGNEQSEYDLAIANFGLDAELPEQVIVNMMIAHRRMHGGKPKPRADYYLRTLDRAFKRIGGTASGVRTIQTPEVTPEPKPLPEPVRIDAPRSGSGRPESAPDAPGWVTDEPGPDEAPKPAPEAKEDADAIKRASTCEEISRRIGFQIIRILKVTGKDPTFILDLPSGKIEFSEVSKLVNQTAVRMAVLAHTSIFVEKIRPKDWEGICKMMFQAITVIEGGADLDFEGQITGYLQRYLTDCKFTHDFKKATVAQLYEPTVIWTNGNEVHISVSSTDIQQFLGRTYGQKLTIKAISSALAAIGARPSRLRHGSIDQSRWLLPRAEFDAAKYDAVTAGMQKAG